MQTWLRNRSLRAFVAWSTCFSLALPSAVIAGDGPLGFVDWHPKGNAVEQLAERIDHMERSLDEYGSIVIKTPDVWGESRLMRHRSDVENQLKARLNGFQFRINAIQSTRDAAFLATAIAVQEQIAAADSKTGMPGDVALGGTPPAGASSVNNATFGMIGDPNASSTKFVPRNDFNSPFLNVDGKQATTLSVGIEPVIELDQVSRYLHHLNELRRLNEGDDNADTPGYALNLIRIPVSVLPGRKTEEGYGAEVQITVDPYISEEVLPLAFKDFVINGLVDRISFDVFQIALTSDIDKLYEECKNNQRMYWQAGTPQARSASLQFHNVSLQDAQEDVANSAADTQTSANTSMQMLQAEKVYGTLMTRELTPDLVLEIAGRAADYESIDKAKTVIERNTAISKFLDTLVEDNVITKEKREPAQTVVEAGGPNSKVAVARFVGPYSLADVNQQDLAISASHRPTVDGDTLLRLALHSYKSLVQTGRNAWFPYKNAPEEPVPPSHRTDHGLTMPEVQSLMKREAVAAYEFLQQPNASHLWTLFSGPEVARLIREHRRDMRDPTQAAFALSTENVDRLVDARRQAIDVDRADISVDPLDGLHVKRDEFFREMQRSFPQARNSVLEALVWQILVESALVNDQLCKDMKETASLKNCPCVTGDWMQFYGPHTTPEARMAFREYVKCKWPIHVFALDPVTQDQNIADSFSQRREMQMSLAVAAASTGMGGQALSRFVRRMEYDLETIELNRTAIAFSHGDNTFGWRFYPRVQSPPVPGNLQAAVGDLLVGGQDRDDLVRTRKLEPGIRECTALVVMPSFVPQVTVDVRSNYFRLAKHTPIHEFMHRKPGYESSIELSRELTELRRLQQQCIKDAHQYRDGEVFRLCKAVERLDDRLPLQTHNVTVPWENDLGGFEVFQSGAQVLEPELHGWYGTPGIVTSGTQNSRSAIVALNVAIQATAQANLEHTLVPVGKEYDATRAEKLKVLMAAKDAEGKARDTFAAVIAAQTDTATFLVGKNFSVLNCRVIAGGVDVTNTIEVINRNLMQVRIPSTVSTVTTEHESNGRYVVVHLATPHGATSRLLIPVAGQSEASTADEALKTAKAAKVAADEVKGKLESTISSATTATNEAKLVSNRMPVSLHWGADGADKTFAVKVENTNGRLTKKYFCPVSNADSNIVVVERKQSSPWSEPNSVRSVGQLALFVSVGELQRKPVGSWKIKNGKIDDVDFTAEALLDRILEKIGKDISCPENEPLSMEIEGFVKFNNGQPVVRIDNKITYQLKPEKKE